VNSALHQATFAAVAALSMMWSAFAEEGNRVEMLDMRSGSVMRSGEVQGMGRVDYRIAAVTAQRLRVKLSSNHVQTNIDVLRPSGSELSAAEPIASDEWAGTILESGTHTIRISLLGPAARRDEIAKYTVTIALDSVSPDWKVHSSAKPNPVANKQLTPAAMTLASPEYWQVTGIKRGDTLRIRAGPSTAHATLGHLKAEDTGLLNQGCELSQGRRWCKITSLDGVTGWVAAAYLREAAITGNPTSNRK